MSEILNVKRNRMPTRRGSGFQIYRCLFLALTFFLGGGVCLEHTVAQGVVVNGYGGYTWGYNRPGDVVAARMHAYANVVRSYGYGASKYGEYLIRRERAISMNLDNRMKRLKYYFDAKRINRAYREETHYDVRERQMLSNSRMWQQVKSLPELANKNSGAAQNFLLHRLSSTVLSFQYASERGLLNDQEWVDYLQLEPEAYAHIWLKQGETRFAASTGQSLDLTWWPHQLRDPQFAGPREKFMDARNAIAQEVGSTIEYDELSQLSDAHQALADAVNVAFQEAEKTSGFKNKDRKATDTRSEWRRAFRFLDGMHVEIRKLKQSGSRALVTGQMGFDPNAEEANFIAFLQYMQRNGLEFAPASKDPQSIAAYNTMFLLMRDLYVLAAEGDSAITDPKKKYRNR
ncbi:MAG: hypothetical protein P8J33_09410 [Pirellulaceae bacterium]|nr:hypothetical protein [Pirellulaceae bacterium]